LLRDAWRKTAVIAGVAASELAEILWRQKPYLLCTLSKRLPSAYANIGQPAASFVGLGFKSGCCQRLTQSPPGVGIALPDQLGVDDFCVPGILGQIAVDCRFEIVQLALANPGFAGGV